MSTIFKLINEDIVPDNLATGKYHTKVGETYWDDDSNLVIEIEFTGKKYNPNDPCLFPLIKENEISPGIENV